MKRFLSPFHILRPFISSMRHLKGGWGGGREEVRNKIIWGQRVQEQWREHDRLPAGVSQRNRHRAWLLCLVWWGLPSRILGAKRDVRTALPASLCLIRWAQQIGMPPGSRRERAKVSCSQQHTCRKAPRRAERHRRDQLPVPLGFLGETAQENVREKQQPPEWTVLLLTKITLLFQNFPYWSKYYKYVGYLTIMYSCIG